MTSEAVKVMTLTHFYLFCRESDELAAVVEYLETKSVVNPKEIALAKREEMKKKGEIKSPVKKKGRKSKFSSGIFLNEVICMQ